MARGTDLITSEEVNRGGGLHLILLDVFSTLVHEQIIGRTGRLGNPGSW